MTGNCHPKRSKEQEPADNGWRSTSRQAVLDFIPFPLYYISTLFGGFLSFVLLPEGDDG